jgi:hypothetical protein
LAVPTYERAGRLMATRGTDKDDDDDYDKNIDQPQKLRKRNDRPDFKYDNSTFEGAVAWYIAEGMKNNSIDGNVTANELANFTIQGSFLPDT